MGKQNFVRRKSFWFPADAVNWMNNLDHEIHVIAITDMGSSHEQRINVFYKKKI